MAEKLQSVGATKFAAQRTMTTALVRQTGNGRISESAVLGRGQTWQGCISEDGVHGESVKGLAQGASSGRGGSAQKIGPKAANHLTLPRSLRSYVEEFSGDRTGEDPHRRTQRSQKNIFFEDHPANSVP